MGFLDGLFKKNARVENKTNKTRIREEYEMPSRDGVNTIVLFRITPQGSIKHRNQDITRLVTARIMKNRDGDTMFVDSSDYISFELPEGIEINQEILNAVMRQYDLENNGQKSYYVGRLMSDQGKAYFGNKSNAVQNMVNDIVMSAERKRQEELNASIIARRKSEKEFRNSVVINNNNYEKEMKRIREQRVSNPVLENKRAYKINGKTYMDYDGIDTCGGEILRLRKVDKVGKDGEANYLYSAYISKTPNEDDVEFLNGDNPAGYPVCFTLGKRLEDIVNQKSKSEIDTLLELLSNPYNFIEPNRLAYIGNIDKNGRINLPSSEDRFDNKDSLTAIGIKIRAMQQEYARKIEAKRQQRGER